MLATDIFFLSVTRQGQPTMLEERDEGARINGVFKVS